jgi:hypothetical protein
MVMSPAGLGPENDCAGETSSNCKRQTSSLTRGCYIRTITASVQLKKKNAGRGSQGAGRQDKPIGGKLPAGK